MLLKKKTVNVKNSIVNFINNTVNVYVGNNTTNV